MISFSSYLKTIEIVDMGEFIVPIYKIYAQYNYDRFNKWKSLFNDSDKDILDMKISPHYDFLKSYEKMGENINILKSRYYKMHLMYGKNKKWIKNKIINFINLYKYVKNGNNIDSPIILEHPIINNPYNRGYEIYEGHHRVAIYLFLNREKIKVTLSLWKDKQ